MRITLALRWPTLWKPLDNWPAGYVLFIKTAVKIVMNPVAYPPKSPRLRDQLSMVMRSRHEWLRSTNATPTGHVRCGDTTSPLDRLLAN
ncbi:hypothetical protein THICB2_280061 [Thiomonas sp. CB2]|nr:hypothetical protein THICB2_280061 [Thiomonas sp. CB2]VDY05435.1 protein of unknown function [Thiomonas sp. Bio17B3]VDY07401.1 protein of unknown function [Thiomonas sp. Sup16B3]VDY13685.1 conserved protein of unknown function [Thiomonas sp. OC7]VDY17114.1 protein of unknown function [Thiomonas sp. CB2]